MNLFKSSFYSKLVFLIRGMGVVPGTFLSIALNLEPYVMISELPCSGSLEIRLSWVLGADLTNTPCLSGEKQPSFVIFSSTLDYLQMS